jgi:hypothetical protein
MSVSPKKLVAPAVVRHRGAGAQFPSTNHDGADPAILQAG